MDVAKQNQTTFSLDPQKQQHIATWLQSAQSVTRRCISVSDGRFISSRVFEITLRGFDPARFPPKDTHDRGSLFLGQHCFFCNAIVP